MITIRDYRKVESLDEAWELNQKRMNRVVGGMLWMKMGTYNVQTAIDLSGLGLDVIEEDENEFRIGCMVSLRQLELHEGLAQYTDGAMREAVRHIVGVQFRNLATVGGSIFGRYGFSDVLSLFLALDSYVELHKGGILPLQEFAKMDYNRDILVRLIVKKTPAACHYQSVRATRTDFPILTCAAAIVDGQYRFSIGARPNKAMLVTDTEKMLDGELTEEKMDAFAAWMQAQIHTGSNLRGSAEYRSHLVKVVTKRALMALKGGTEC